MNGTTATQMIKIIISLSVVIKSTYFKSVILSIQLESVINSSMYCPGIEFDFILGKERDVSLMTARI